MNNHIWRRAALLALSLLAAGLLLTACGGAAPGWSKEQLAAIRGLWLGSLTPLPPDPSNRVADDPRAAALGRQIFFDTRFSGNGAVSCATCHRPDANFQDGVRLGVGMGTGVRRTMPIAGTAYSPWFFWDGHKDSLWAQATGPMENPAEHGGDRTMYAHLVAAKYRDQYEALFGPLPDLADAKRFPPSAGPVDGPQRAAWDAMAAADREAVSRVYANMGKAIEAYERKLMPGPARFDKYAEAVLKGDNAAGSDLLTADEVAGLRLFIGKADCTKCHNGPLFTNNDFHNTGIPAAADLPADVGRANGAKQVLADEFNCLGKFSDAGEDDCAELKFLTSEGESLERAFKPPSLRNVAERAPYMHAGQFKTLAEVLHHYNTAPAAPSGHSELEPLRLSDAELGQLEAFLRTLSGPVAGPRELVEAPALP